MGEIKTIFIVSDGTGVTAQRMLDATLAQFKNKAIEIKTYTYIRSPEQVDEIIQQAIKENAMVAYSLVSRDTQQEMMTRANENDVITADLLGNLIGKLSRFLAAHPVSRPGLSPQIDENYFKRIDAIGFTVRHDDGLGLSDLDAADIILTGVSRTSKTPLSMYLAYTKGLLVANVPIAYGLEPPVELLECDPRKVVGLTMNAGVLSQIRRTRLASLGKVEIEYANIDFVRKDLEYSHRLFRRNPEWVVIDTTGKALEENAENIYTTIKTKNNMNSNGFS